MLYAGKNEIEKLVDDIEKYDRTKIIKKPPAISSKSGSLNPCFKHHSTILFVPSPHCSIFLIKKVSNDSINYDNFIKD